MSHTLQALIVPVTGRLELLPPAAHPVRLGEHFVLVPNTEELFDLLTEQQPRSSQYDDVFWKFHPALVDLGTAVAGSRPFAYLETDYFGGRGNQAAGAWCDNECIVAPRKAEIGPINQVLQTLGVGTEPGLDEFDSIGLSRHRHVEDWLDEPRFPFLVPPSRVPQIRHVRRLRFSRPSEPLSALMVDVLGQVVAQVDGVIEAYVPECSINGERSAHVLVLGIAEGVAESMVMDALLPKLRLLLGAGEHLDVLPFRFSILPEDARIPECVVYRKARTSFTKPWWKFW